MMRMMSTKSNTLMCILLMLTSIFMILSPSIGFSLVNNNNHGVTKYSISSSYKPHIVLKMTTDESSAVDDDDEDDEEEEVVEPGKMRVSEIKAELDMRGINYKDCFDKESLQQRLSDARATGKANPKIIDNFNKQKVRGVVLYCTGYY